MAIKTYKKGSKDKLSANFKVSEFACHGDRCCDTVLIDEKLVEYLQAIRDHFGKPVTITSAYRCETHNKKIGGATGSRHTKGQAADIAVSGVKPAEVAKYAESIGILGIGLYEDKDGNFVHVDTRTTKYFWYGHGQARRTTFGGTPVSDEPVVTIMEWQLAAIADGFTFPKYGADGKWGKESASVAEQAIVKRGLVYTHKNLTKLVQRAVGVTEDGKFGKQTEQAVIEYKRKHKLVANGEVDSATWAVILGV